MSTSPGADGSGEPEGAMAGSGSGPGADPTADAPFDPYRYGAPEVPPPPEYAPPGYVPPAGYVPPKSPPVDTRKASSGSGDGTRYPGPPLAPPPPGYPPPGYPPPGYPPPGYPPPGYPPPGYPPAGAGPYGPGYGQPGYGYPYGPAPGQPPYGPPARGNGKAVTALVLGIVSIALSVTSYFDVLIIVPAVVFGIIGRRESAVRRSGRGQAVAGLICAAVGTVLAVGFTLVYVHVSNSCRGIDTGSPAYKTCVRNSL